MLKVKQLEPSCAESYNTDLFQGIITVYVLSGAASQSDCDLYGG
jgi:hypothetical protein